MKIGKTIRDLREKRNISQNDLSKKCNITQSYLSLVENDKKEVSHATLEVICNELKVPAKVIYFFSMEEQDIALEDKECVKDIVRHAKALFYDYL
jgi:transcriptional regulator with XRE-family HTH domain